MDTIKTHPKSPTEWIDAGAFTLSGYTDGATVASLERRRMSSPKNPRRTKTYSITNNGPSAYLWQERRERKPFNPLSYMRGGVG